MRSLSRQHSFWLAGGLAFYLVFLVRGERHLFQWFGPHEYWATHWARDYSGGFARRGLLGEIISFVGADNTSYALITLITFLAFLTTSTTFSAFTFITFLTRSTSFSTGSIETSITFWSNETLVTFITF